MAKFFVFALLILAVVEAGAAQDNIGFALHLLPPEVRASDLSKLDLKKIKPRGNPFFTSSDMVWYIKDTHEMVLAYAVGQRVKNLDVPVSGRPFVVFVGDEAVYSGAFWSRLSSVSFKGVVINVSDLKGDFPDLKLELGHPAEPQGEAYDPRADPRIFKALEKRGVLREEVWMYGKCKKIEPTQKRRQSFIFTFDVVSVIKSTYTEREVVFEIHDDIGKSLRSKVKAKWRRVDQSGTVWENDPQKEILLKFTRRVSDKSENVSLYDFEAKD